MDHPDTVRSAYIHVPFCVHRCGYCDFTLVAGRDHLIGDYLRAMRRELATVEGQPELETLFLGGGTPTHLPPADLQQLLELLRETFTLSPDAEFSVEANPAGLTAEKVRLLADAGVNRVSLGVQSFTAEVLQLLERDHRSTDIRAAVETVRERVPNFSLDLIFAVPGQSLEDWERTLRQAVELQPTHVSTYGLTFEKGTAFWSRRERGELVCLPEETERAMYALSMETLSAAGFEQYEISNFARPGFACRHNQIYWTGKPFYGFGPGAARYRHGCREVNHRSVTAWLKKVLAGESPIAESETLSPEDHARERLVLGLRRVQGVSLDDFATETGFSVEQLAADPLRQHLDEGLLEIVAGHLRLTRAGRFLADTVVVDFL